MDGNRLEQQIAFILEIDKAKDIMRQTFLTNGQRRENDAEHSWHLAMMAFILREYFGEKVDVLRVIMMALMHDLVEIDAGDTYCYDEAANLDKAEREEKAAARIYGLLPEDQGKEYLDLWQEFEERETEEAKFANILDRLQPILLNYKTGGRGWKEHGVYSAQVLGRNGLALSGPPEIAALLRLVVQKAEEKGYLKKREEGE